MTPSFPASRTRIRLACLGLVLAILPGLPAQTPEEAQPPADAALLQIRTRLTAGFTRADANLVASVFSRRIKTYVACSPLAADHGYYGADQMRLLLRRMFRGRQTSRFQLLEPTTAQRPDGHAVVTALWSYRESGASGGEVRLSFGVAPESDGWRVREIRDLK